MQRAAAASVLLVLVAAWATAMAALSDTEKGKISADLLQAIQGNENQRVDVLVQLTSPSQALQNSCERADSQSMDHSQRASCVAESLQSFAEQTQQPVKDLLNEHTDRFSSSTFLWISNAVSVQGACGDLVMDLARLDAVEKIDMDQLFDAFGTPSGSLGPSAGSAMFIPE